MATNSMVLSQVELEQRSFIVKVYGWMSFALAVTALTAMVTASIPALIYTIVQSRFLLFGLLIGELVLVGYLSAAIQKMTAATATAVFIGYSFLNGLTLSTIFWAFTRESIASTFFITAGTFGAVSVYGYVTKRDLTSAGNFFMMGLFGMIIASLVNLFFRSPAIYWVTTYLGIVIFVGLTAYDTQKIKNMNVIGNEGTDEDKKEAIMGALILYLDFINLFLLFLRLFGRRK
jgi:FtsH-binding integral membrane protein